MCEYIGIRLTGYVEKQSITEIVKITVQLFGEPVTVHGSISCDEYKNY